MSDILLISGSPSAQSRSGALLQYAVERLNVEGFSSDLVSVRDYPAEDLILGKYDSPSFVETKRLVAEARGLIVATPVYKAAYTGSLKALLDILPTQALRNKTVLPIATGGSPAHLLVLDYALKPVLGALGAFSRRINLGSFYWHQGIASLNQRCHGTGCSCTPASRPPL